MGAPLEQLGMQLGQQVISNVQKPWDFLWGTLMGKYNDGRQLRQNQALMDQNIAGNEKLTDYNYQKQLQMFQDTGYGAQMNQLEAAGLNPALMYAKGGPGGSTNVATGQVSGQDAPKGGHEQIDMMQMGMQGQLQSAQITNMLADAKTKESQAKLNDAQALKLGGIDTQVGQEQASNLHKDSLLKVQQQQLAEAQTKLNDIQVEISLATKQAQEDKIKADAVNTILQAGLIKSGVAVNEAQVNKMTQDIIQRGQEITIDAFKAQIEANFKGISEQAGNIVAELYEGIRNILGLKQKDRLPLKPDIKQ